MDNFVSFVRIPVVVVLPLVNLMKDQVSYLRSIGVSSISLSDLKEGGPGKVVKAAYSVVFGTPQSWMKNIRWRELFSSSVYMERLRCLAINEAYVIKQFLAA